MVQKHELRGQVASLDEHIIKIQPMHCEKHQVRVLGSLPRCTGLGMATRRYQASQLLLTARVAECHFVAEFGKITPRWPPMPSEPRIPIFISLPQWNLR